MRNSISLKQRVLFIVYFTIVIFFSFVQKVDALLPPDIVVSLGSQIAQVFGMVMIFFSSLGVGIAQFVQARSGKKLIKRKYIIIGSVGVLLLAMIVTFVVIYW